MGRPHPQNRVYLGLLGIFSSSVSGLLIKSSFEIHILKVQVQVLQSLQLLAAGRYTTNDKVLTRLEYFQHYMD